jgi:hypothetical protein
MPEPINYLGALFNKTKAIIKNKTGGIHTAIQGAKTPVFPAVLKIWISNK